MTGPVLITLARINAIANVSECIVNEKTWLLFPNPQMLYPLVHNKGVLP